MIYDLERTPEACKEYLLKIGRYNKDWPDMEMMGIAKQLHRKEQSNNPERRNERLFGILNNYITLAECNAKMAEMKASGEAEKMFVNVRCVIDDMQDKYLVMRHELGAYGTSHCNGQIDDGKCKKCNMVGIFGEPDFLFSINVTNCDDERTSTSSFMVCGSGGKSLFNGTAEAVSEMDEMDQVIRAGAWCGYPVLIKGNIHYNPSSGYVSFFAYGFKKFPAKRGGGAGPSDAGTPPAKSNKRVADQEAARSSKRHL